MAGARVLNRLPACRIVPTDEYVCPYVKTQKNNDRDAEALAEAGNRPTMRFVALESEPQLDVQMVHWVRDQFVGERTALMDRVRAIQLEHSHIVAQGQAKLAACLTALLDTEMGSSLTQRSRTLVAKVCEQRQPLNRRSAPRWMPSSPSRPGRTRTCVG